MEHLTIVPHADGMLADVDQDSALMHEEEIMVGGLTKGMQSGKPSVVLAIKYPGGKVAVAQTSLALFLSAADGLKAAHGDPREEE